MTAAGCEQIFLDTASGKLARRPEPDKALLSANRAGDQLVVTKLDRLGRSQEHLMDLSKTLQERGVDLVVLDQNLDTSTPLSGCASRSSGRSRSSNMPSCPNGTQTWPAPGQAGPGNVCRKRPGRQAGSHGRTHCTGIRRHPADELPAPSEARPKAPCRGLLTFSADDF
ncbi:recombinase family protein [Arthrobacter sp. CC3]|uniref:recombinase family protein n=1 Tax=Arthrobacter sp. CC3 TaxID=3029185 RepID=UPI003267BE03